MTNDDASGRPKSCDTVRLPKRSRKYGVGKEIGGAVYVHRDYEDVFGVGVAEACRQLPTECDYTVVKLNLANSAYSFIQAADFDTAPEPTIGSITTVKQDGTIRSIRPAKDPYIYHHKWLFVADDYTGFDVEESKRRSRAWMSLPDVDKSRIGRKSYWEKKVVPRLSTQVRDKPSEDH